MKQLLLAIVLILVPVAAFAMIYSAIAPKAVSTSGLGDLTQLKTIVADVQARAARGDMAGATTRMTDYESAWDQGQTAIRQLNPTYWGHVDAASDAAIKALREPKPVAVKVGKTLANLAASLNDPSKAVP